MQSMKLVHGEGSPTTGACWMSAIRMYEGGAWGDQPDCVCPVIRRLCIRLNDSFGEGPEADRKRGEFIGPHLFEPVGTRGSVETMLKRSFFCADRAVRVYAPMALRAKGKEAEAAKLESLSPIVDRATALVGSKAAAAYAAADAAAYAAYDAAAAYAAAYAAADAAADAAYDAAAAAAAAAARQELTLQLILDLCRIDDKRPVEAACTVAKVRKFCSLAR